MTLRLGGDGAITGCTSLEEPTISISGLTMTTPIEAISGTAAAPSYTFSGDTDNGLYYAGTNSIGVSTAGTSAIVVDASQRVGIGTTSPSLSLHVKGNQTRVFVDTANASSTVGLQFGDNGSTVGGVLYTNTDDALYFQTSGINERMRIDSSGIVLVGTTSAVQVGPSSQTRLQISREDNSANIRILRTSANQFPPYFSIGKGRGTLASPAIVQVDDELGRIVFSGHDGTDYAYEAASISAFVDETPGANDVPGRLAFSTAQSGSTASVKMIIDDEGRLGIRTDDPQVSFDLAPPISTCTMRVQARTGSSPRSRIQLMRGVSTTFGGDSATDWEIENGTNGELAIISGHSTQGTNQRLHFQTDGKINLGPDNAVYALLNLTQSNSASSFPVTTTATEPAGPSIDLYNENGSTGCGASINAVGLGTKGRYASISFYDSTSDNTGTGGGIIFATSSSKTGNLIERCRILPQGGIAFQGDTSTSNAINDYEEGVWNPEVSFGGSSTSVTYSEQNGTYIKIGDMVWASAVITLTNNGTGTGNFEISLPFAVGSNSEQRGAGVLTFTRDFANLTQLPHTYASGSGATKVQVIQINSTGSDHENLTNSNVTNSAQFRAQMQYLTF